MTGGNRPIRARAAPKVMPDLQGQVTLVARMSAVDPAGDRVEGSASVLLSEDAIQASAVTDLGGGLVAGTNNHACTCGSATADGRVLAGNKIHVKRAWQANDQRHRGGAHHDDDSVASLQLDPGAPGQHRDPGGAVSPGAATARRDASGHHGADRR